MSDTNCGYETRAGEPCRNPATGDDGYCWLKSHSNDGPDSESDGRGAPEKNENSQTHGAFKEHFRSDLQPEERDAINSLVEHLTDINDERAIAAECAAEALMKYKRSADSRFLREARQWFADFNLIPNEDVFEHTGEGGSPLDITIRHHRREDLDEPGE